MPTHNSYTTTPTVAPTIAARAPFAPLTTTFTPNPPCATPALYGCTVVTGIGDERTIACAASHYTETRCSQSYSCYPDQGASGYTHWYTYSPASICPVGFTTAGSRIARGTEPGGVACCPTGYSWASSYYGGYVDCDREPMTEGTLAVVLVEPSTLWQTLCTAVPTTLTWAAQGPSATLAYIQYNTLVTAVGRISINFNAQGVFLKDHTLTGSYTNLLSTTASTTSSTTTTLNFFPVGGGGGGGGGAPTTAELETEFNIKVGVGVGVAAAGIILSTVIGCCIRRSRAKKRRLRQAEAAGGSGGAMAPAMNHTQSGPGLLSGVNGDKPELHAPSPPTATAATGATAREGQQFGASTAYGEMDGGNTRPTPELDLHEAPRPAVAHSRNGTRGAPELLGHSHQQPLPSQTYQTQELGGNARSELHGDYQWYHPPEQHNPEQTQQQNQARLDREMQLRQQLEAIRAQEQQITRELQGLGK
ncbi:axial budding pattern protein 2 [Microdochium nivale]|nr:axial budding pattern protein 2 [Microdochium nivale]